MKKITVILLTVFLFLYACGEKEPSKQESLNEDTVTVPDSELSTELTSENLRTASLNGTLKWLETLLNRAWTSKKLLEL